jgi:hypothetical protein
MEGFRNVKIKTEKPDGPKVAPLTNATSGIEPNYIVVTHSWKGTEITECHTVDEAWKAVGNMSFGGIYDVTSPTGQCTEEFVSF